MKKKILTIFVIIIFIAINSTISIGASANTYFYLETIKIQNSNIEIISNEMIIDTITSKIQNRIILQNSSDEEIETELIIPLENKEFATSIRDLTITLNDVKVKYVKDNEGNYIINTKISGKSYKKIYIKYYTENDLQKARLIKCNFDNLKDRKVGKLKVDFKIDDKNIPLVEQIYPGHYKFNNNTISIEYYNYEVNTLTKDILIKKETFSNLLYGREVEINNEDRNIINTWYKTGNINIDKQKYIESQYEKHKDEKNYEYGDMNYFVNNIIDYQYIKDGRKIGEDLYEVSEPLLSEIYKDDSNDRDLDGKIICIDYVETEGNNKLYVSKITNVKYDPDTQADIAQEEIVRKSERTILKTEIETTSFMRNRGARLVFVNQGIEGENLNATEQEKIKYINQINADMYIRIEIYDGKIEYKTNAYGGESRIGTGMVGYYDNNNLEIAKTFALCEFDKLKDEEIYNNAGYYEEYSGFYSNYEEYAKNYYSDYYKDCIIKLQNDDISNKCEVPTVVQFIGNRVIEDGKYVIEYFDYSVGFFDGDSRGLITTNATLQTAQAKKMLSKNKQKNSNIKFQIENKISNLTINDDEQKIQKEIQDKIEERQKQEELKKLEDQEAKKQDNSSQQKLENKHIIVFLSIVLGITICIIILIVKYKKINN